MATRGSTWTSSWSRAQRRTGRRFHSGIALIKRQQLLLFSSLVPPNQIYGANNLYAGPAFHSNRDASCSSLLQIRADGREWLTAAGRGELWRVRTCEQEATAGGSNGCLVEDAWRLKEKLTRGTHMSASGDRDAAGVFWSIRKIYMCTST